MVGEWGKDISSDLRSHVMATMPVKDVTGKDGSRGLEAVRVRRWKVFK